MCIHYVFCVLYLRYLTGLPEHFLLKDACCCEDNGGSLKTVYWFVISTLPVLGIIP